jgi:hypothetical protein
MNNWQNWSFSDKEKEGYLILFNIGYWPYDVHKIWMYQNETSPTQIDDVNLEKKSMQKSLVLTFNDASLTLINIESTTIWRNKKAQTPFRPTSINIESTTIWRNKKIWN